MDEIEQEGLRLCQQLREKLAAMNTLFETRTKEIECFSHRKGEKTTSKKHLMIDTGAQ